MADPSFEFKPGSLKRNLRAFDGDINALVAGVVDYRGPKAITYMKEKAPWKDRTGNARATLDAYAQHSAEWHELHLHGGMPYQIFLETRFGGQYGIIGKAVKVQGVALMKQLNRLITKLGAA